jgi:diguanylate cyclase (GGDEF)-like protein
VLLWYQNGFVQRFLKQINDNYGHPTGDEVLREVANRMRKRCRESDTLGRYGGEEFALLLPNTDREGARILAETMRQTVASTPIEVNGKSLNITASFGVACSSDLALIDEASLIAQADIKLYEAKSKGRNRVAI